MKPPRSRLPYLLCFSCALLLVDLLVSPAQAQDTPNPPLARSRYRTGEETLRAFAPVSASLRRSIVKLNVDGRTVALGTVVDSAGLALTKASEVSQGKLTCWLAEDREVDAEVLASDADADLALVRVKARDLTPVSWASNEVALGQWAITPGIADTPQAVGIVSALPRRIRPQRAFVGVQFVLNSTVPEIEQVMTGFGAEKAGVRPGDIIRAVNGQSVTNREQVVDTLREFREGQTVTLHLERTNGVFDAEVRLQAPGADLLEPGLPERLTGTLSRRSEGFEQVLEHDTVLPPWLCGGPLVDLDGKVIGINIARAGRVSTYALPAKIVRRVLQTLKSTPVRAPARLQPSAKS